MVVVGLDEVAVEEAGAFVEDVIIRLRIKNIILLQLIILLNLIFNHKTHKAKTQTQVLLQQQPIIIFTIASMPEVLNL